jgi:hypothetical protein
MLFWMAVLGLATQQEPVQIADGRSFKRSCTGTFAHVNPRYKKIVTAWQNEPYFADLRAEFDTILQRFLSALAVMKAAVFEILRMPANKLVGPSASDSSAPLPPEQKESSPENAIGVSGPERANHRKAAYGPTCTSVLATGSIEDCGDDSALPDLRLAHVVNSGLTRRSTCHAEYRTHD